VAGVVVGHKSHNPLHDGQGLTVVALGYQRKYCPKDWARVNQSKVTPKKTVTNTIRISAALNATFVKRLTGYQPDQEISGAITRR